MSHGEVVYASAGFGKTFRISSRIIELLARGEAPSSILASTFTRKAAGEILDRVLRRMAHAATDDAAAAALTVDVFGDDPEEAPVRTAQEWADLLAAVVRELQQIRVSTLDSFFQRVVRIFGNELGLIPGWTVADAPTGERMLRDALELLFERAVPRDLLDLVRALHPGEVRRSIHEKLLEDIDALVRASQDLAPGAPGWAALEADLPQLPRDVPATARAVAEALADAPVPQKKSGGDDARWRTAVRNAAQAVREQDWPGLYGVGLGKKLLTEDEPTYYNATFPPDLVLRLEEALELARAVEGRRLVRRAQALGRLARLFQEAYAERMRDAGALRFEDVTRLMAGVSTADDGAAPPTREDFQVRLGEDLMHVLLDEFQDTSLTQWRALTPLLDRVSGSKGEGKTLVVADPKQSIYGWRGAAPAVVEGAADRYDLARETLPLSWRSSPPVLDAVNRVFTDLERLPVLQDTPEDADTAAAWGRAFIQHRSSPKTEGLPGRVRLVTGPELEGTKAAQPGFMRAVARHVAAVAAAAPGRSIGVLTRQNQSVGRIIFELGALGVPASQEGGTPLGDSPAVAAVFAVLRLADHPGDRLAQYHVSHTPLGPIVGLEAPDGAQADRVASRIRAALVAEGYGPWLSRLVEELEPLCDRREMERLARLANLGYQWDRSSRGGSLRVTAFLDRAMAERVQSASDDRVRVMTIHQAKGLEFDLVVLAELHGADFSGGRGAPPPIVHRPDPTAQVTHIYPGMSSSLMSLFQEVGPLRAGAVEARAAGIRDSLSMLYVAMTRARYGLDLFVPADPPADSGRKRSRARTHARLIREAIGLFGKEERIEEGAVWEIQGGQVRPLPQVEVDAYGWEDLPAEPRAAPALIQPFPGPVHLRVEGPRRRQRDRTSPSAKEGGGRVDVRFNLGLNDLDGRARAKGTLVHAWMEELEWLEEGLPDDEALLRLAARIAPELPEPVVREYLAWTREKLEAPEVAAALHRASAPRGAETRAEVPILVPDGEDALMRGLIDRLVLTREDGVLTAARVLDFKTDAIPEDDPGALQERIEHYRPQMEAYCEAVHLQFGVPPERVSAALIFLEVGRVCEVV